MRMLVRLVPSAMLAAGLVATMPGAAVAATYVPATSGTYLNAWCGDNPPMAVNPDGSVFHPGTLCGQRFRAGTPGVVESVTYHTGGMNDPICGHFVVKDVSTGLSSSTATRCSYHYQIVTATFSPPAVQTGTYDVIWVVDAPSPGWCDAHVYGHTRTP